MGKAWHLGTPGFRFGSATVWLCGLGKGLSCMISLQLYDKAWETSCSGLLPVLRVQKPVPFRVGVAACHPWSTSSGGGGPLAG